MADEGKESVCSRRLIVHYIFVCHSERSLHSRARGHKRLFEILCQIAAQEGTVFYCWPRHVVLAVQNAGLGPAFVFLPLCLTLLWLSCVFAPRFIVSLPLDSKA
jgi:hypothetical protein